jgi:hypothetical protein
MHAGFRDGTTILLLCDDPCDAGPVWLSQILSACDCSEKGVLDPSRVLPREGGCFDSPSPPAIQNSHPVAQIATRMGTPDSSVLAAKILDAIFKWHGKWEFRVEGLRSTFLAGLRHK